MTWLQSGDAGVDTTMRAVFAARRGEHAEAISLLDTLIETRPDYAEAWNQRATTYFEIGDDEASLSDIAETLRREPRHFGALAGRAMIRIRRGEISAAIADIEAAMRLHPFLGERRFLPALRRAVQERRGRPI
ncbi:MAG: tetratricopeptide repeat protein [Burkholderiaceae bacterium]